MNAIKILKTLVIVYLSVVVTQDRASFAATVIEILQRNNLNHLGNLAELYLYGHQLLHRTDNKTILLSTIK